MLKHVFSRLLVAVLVTVSLVCQGTWVLAGTTGALTGTVTDASSGQGLAGAKVTVASPSQTATSTTDGSGHYSFLDLAPDTYVVSAEYQAYTAQSVSGVTVVADNTRVLTVTLEKNLKTIGRVTSRSASSLVKPGTTADVYSINALTQSKVAAAGGGGNLDSAFAALATVPGVSVAPGQNGYIGAAATLSIRGGDYDQIGYQIDGVPVNRAFDNYPSGPTSSLGQQELQVYTGAPPASSTSEGISGYINQVIKTGTRVPFDQVTYGEGGPAYYHKLAVELGGETGNGRLSYYLGIGGYNQDFRAYDNFNGAALSNNYGAAYGVPCGAGTQAQAPSCFTSNGTPYNASAGNALVLGPFNLFLPSSVIDRDTDINLHYYFPHKDGSRDDIQALFQSNYLDSKFYSSTQDQGGAATLNAIGVGAPFYIDGTQLNLPTGGFLPANYQSLVSNYNFQNVQTHNQFDPINPTERDGFLNDQDIVKLQYTKSLGSNAYARVYGYTYYSDWLNTGPQCTYFDGNCGVSADYQLSSHTRGLSFTIADQLNAQNLLNLEGDATKSSVVRSNNTEFENSIASSGGLRRDIAVVVDSSNPTNGVCYTTTGVAAPCFTTATALNTGGAGYATLAQAAAGTIAPITGTGCGAGTCQYLVIGNGQYATYNQVDPTFYGASLTDEFRPNSRLTLNAGLRLDVYQYQGADTSGTNARAFFYNAYNREMCESSTTKLLTAKDALGLATTDPCPAGYTSVNFQNPSGHVTSTYPEFQPRLGFTYSLGPQTVLRASYGRYAQPPNSAFEQYNFLQQEAPVSLYGTYGFQQYGFTSPNHPIPPAASNNYDFSVEHEFPSQLSIKLTPFYRSTQNQIEQFFLNRATNFVSGLNVGNQTSRGFEFELDKGNFAQEGLSAKLAFAYTNSYVKYNTLSNGSTVLTPVVNAINTYNSFTKAGGGAPCYTTAGVAATTCTAADVANPYYNAPLQNASQFTGGSNSYVPYDTIPAGVGVSATGIGFPYVGSLILNEKINKFSITPILQMFAGQRYGNPLGTGGIDPTSCTGVLTSSTTGDPRYNYGAAGGSPYDAATCGTLANGIPNGNTGLFDGIGAFTEPTQFLMHLQLGYDVSKKVTLTANMSNIVNTCFGGTKVAWAVHNACTYTFSNEGLGTSTGNVYNPGDAIQPIGKYTYSPVFTQLPFGVSVNASFRL